MDLAEEDLLLPEEDNLLRLEDEGPLLVLPPGAEDLLFQKWKIEDTPLPEEEDLPLEDEDLVPNP